jgi:hypothetical protein
MTLHALPVHVALVDRTGHVEGDYISQVAGALNRQIQEDFAPIWHVRATVGSYFMTPPDTWTIYIDNQLDEPGALGYHADNLGQPVAYVKFDSNWTITASHELLEMLADPFGSRVHRGRLPFGLEERFAEFGLHAHHSYVSYLLEVCDPPEEISYDIDGVPVSDFIMPHWYRSNLSVERVTFAGSATQPRKLLDGGYVSFHVKGDWWQVYNVRGQLKTAHLGRFDRSSWSNLRAFTDYHARTARPS